MSQTGTQSPLGINVSGSLLQNIGFRLNPVTEAFVGSSKTNDSYTPGSIVEQTCLKWLTYAINEAYAQTPSNLTNATYDSLISIGSTTIPALGNAKPPTYVAVDPAGNWTGEATTGYYLDADPGAGQGQSQTATWIPYTTANTNKSVTQWGFVRLYALQAWNEFNWNGIPATTPPEYKDFIYTFNQAFGYIETTNKAITAAQGGQTFAQGTFSNMNDLMSGNITGVNLATFQFGQDCVTAGKVVDLSKIAKFGFPSVLLQTIAKYNTVTQALSFALLSSGIPAQDLNNIASGSSATKLQEQQLYGAFLTIIDDNLKDILVPLNCKTAGLNSLADLLNIKKLFPNSYQSMTVPIYNVAPGPTNSKTYYPIYENGEVSSRLTTPAILDQIGTIVVPGAPQSSGNGILGTGIQVQDKGFGSPLHNILPDDIATSAGAFAFSMRQISNIQSIEFEKFAQVVYNLETTKGLNLIAGTDTPTNSELAQAVVDATAYGTGIGGGYTMSDFFGCMSGLPYLWNDIQTGITNLQTATLKRIYQNLYLACSWERATLTITYTGTGPYNVTGVTVNNPGGGYGREDGVSPVLTTNVGTGTVQIGTDPNDLSTFGKVTGVTVNITGQPQAALPTATIAYPPSEAFLSTEVTDVVLTTESGDNLVTEGDDVYPEAAIIDYIEDANAEIQAILTGNAGQNGTAQKLITAYELAGERLMIEQRIRYNVFEPVPSPTRDTTFIPYPSTTFSFVDSLPTYAAYTDPNMYAQTIEAIVDLTSIGGESMIAMMRQARNQARLQQLGLTPDDSIPNTLNPKVQQILLANGTAPGALIGVEVSGINGTSTPTIFSMPGTLLQTDSDGNAVAPRPLGYFDPNEESYCLTGDSTLPGQISPLQEIIAAGQHNVNNTNVLGPSLNGTGPAIADEIIAIRAGSSLPAGPCVQDLDVGNAVEPGSLAGSSAQNIIPISMNTAYTSGTLLPAIFTVSEAIDAVIQSNCDCWID
jgi:hypothetical protein